MIAAWMVFTIAVGVLFASAAFAVERMLAHARRPVRFAWLGAIVASVVWPLVLYALAPAAPAAPANIDGFAVNLQRATQIFANLSATRTFVSFDLLLGAVWVVLTIYCAGRLVWGLSALSVGRGEWQPRVMDGVPVLASNAVGPAVVGLRTMHIVLPKWVFDLQPHERTLVLQHEAEHVRARDPYLLWISAIAVTLMPWNPVMWVLARRLRLAVELDCDARVLRTHRDAQRYGSLLLALAQRSAATPALLSPALWEPRTSLERRITAMTTLTRITRARLATLSVVAAAAVLVACSVAAPTRTSTAPAPTPAPTSAAARATANAGTHYEFQVERPATPTPGVGVPVYPPTLKEALVEGKVMASFVVDTAGKVEVTTFKVISSSHELFTSAVRDALPSMIFLPARVSGRAVKQLVQLPFTFSLK